MNESSRGDLGRWGEDLACEYLENKGHTVLERNSRTGHLETDIISIDPNGIHFVEVKTRKAPVQQLPEECVNPAKQKKLVRAAQGWLHKQNAPFLAGQEIFFDVIGIIIEDGNYDIKYMEQAFIPLYI